MSKGPTRRAAPSDLGAQTARRCRPALYRIRQAEFPKGLGSMGMRVVVRLCTTAPRKGRATVFWSWG